VAGGLPQAVNPLSSSANPGPPASAPRARAARSVAPVSAGLRPSRKGALPRRRQAGPGASARAARRGRAAALTAALAVTRHLGLPVLAEGGPGLPFPTPRAPRQRSHKSERSRSKPAATSPGRDGLRRRCMAACDPTGGRIALGACEMPVSSRRAGATMRTIPTTVLALSACALASLAAAGSGGGQPPQNTGAQRCEFDPSPASTSWCVTSSCTTTTSTSSGA
jgi:hypothetical protein